MPDRLLDDVKELLEMQKGDERILRQIHRACENGEVISNYERNYVQKLAAQYLDTKPGAEQSGSAAPDVILPERAPPRQQAALAPPSPAKQAGNTKYVIVGLLALVVLVSVALTVGMPKDDAATPPVEVPPAPTVLSVQTDLSSYMKGDLVSISGRSPQPGSVQVTITSPSGQSAWSENLAVRSGGAYSTLAIAGGPGWSEPGTYTVTATGAGTASVTFLFAP